jgi:hypothetical protein
LGNVALTLLSQTTAESTTHAPLTRVDPAGHVCSHTWLFVFQVIPAGQTHVLSACANRPPVHWQIEPDQVSCPWHTHADPSHTRPPVQMQLPPASSALPPVHTHASEAATYDLSGWHMHWPAVLGVRPAEQRHLLDAAFHTKPRLVGHWHSLAAAFHTRPPVHSQKPSVG